MMYLGKGLRNNHRNFPWLHHADINDILVGGFNPTEKY